MCYYILNNLVELLNGYLTTKSGQIIHSHDLLDIACNCLNPSKVNVKFVYEGKL